MKTPAEREEEVSALRAIKSSVPSRSAFGDDNDGSISAQIQVIEEEMDEDQARREWGDDYIQSSALEAVAWLTEDNPPPSEEWAAMAGV